MCRQRARRWSGGTIGFRFRRRLVPGAFFLARVKWGIAMRRHHIGVKLSNVDPPAVDLDQGAIG